MFELPPLDPSPPPPNRTCATQIPGAAPGVVCGHREISEHAPEARGSAAPRPCRIPGCPCRGFTPPPSGTVQMRVTRAPEGDRPEPETTARGPSATREVGP